jgi:alcohol dehydrogenase class IV
MLGLPADITAATGMDALTHAVEAYLSLGASAETDLYAKNAIVMIFKHLPVVFKQGDNVEAREVMVLASYYAALAFNKALLGYVHGIAHQFGRFYNTPHGLANAIVLPHILEFNRDSCAERLAELSVALELGVSTEPKDKLATRFIEAVREMNHTLHIPSTLDALNQNDIPAIAKIALHETHMACPVPKYMSHKQCELLLQKMSA